MPLPDGTLTKEESEKVQRWLAQHWKKKICPICETFNWTVGMIVDLPTRRPGAVVLGARSYPQVVVMCDTCSYTITFNAVRIGILEGMPEEPQKGEVKDG